MIKINLYSFLFFLIDISITRITNNNKRKLMKIQNIDDLIYINNSNVNATYITSTLSDNGDVYITINTEKFNSLKRFIYIINSDFTQESKTMTIDSISQNIYPLMAILKINMTKYISTFSHKGLFELIDYNKEKVYYSSFEKITNKHSIIYKNTFISLKYYNYSNYILNTFIDKFSSEFIIQKYYYKNPDITQFRIKIKEKNCGKAFINSSVTCFEIDNYIECLYTSSNLIYTVSIFEILNLTNIHNEAIENSVIKSSGLFSKCIYIKKNIGAFIYFIDNNQFPILQFKTLLNDKNEYKLNNLFEPISLNSHCAFPIKANYIYNDIIKTNENNIIYISTNYDGIEIYIIFLKLLNNDKNILINNYKIKINEKFDIKIYKDITAFSLNGLLGIGITNKNSELSENNTYSSFFVIGNLTVNDDININIPYNINIFDEENNFKININEIIEKIGINNNIFGYNIDGIKIISLLDELKLGFYIYSNNFGMKIKTNDIISKNDIISFKMINDIGVKLGNYSFEYVIVIKEPEYEDYISYAYLVEYFPNNDTIDNNIIYKSYFKPDTFSGRKAIINFSVNECYNKCKSCSYYGDDLYHHCDICSIDFPFSFKILNGFNCLLECPENFILIDNKFCLNISNDLNLENDCKKNFYIDENEQINCIDDDICIDKYPHLDKNIKNMCTNCIVKYKNICYIECPENTCINQDINLDTCIDINENTKVINQICFENFQNIANNIKEMNDNNIIIQNNPNLKVYAYEINKDINYFEENKLTYIYFNNIKDILFKSFNLDNNTNIYALIVDSTSKYSNSSINDYGFVLLLENGTELNLLNIKEEFRVNISIPIINLNLTNYNYAIVFSEQGYDIYDKHNEFYHNICTPGYLDEDDLTLKDRKNEIYPNNITMGKTNCEYILTDLNNQRFIYNCNITSINQNNTNNNFLSFFENEGKNENFLNYILDMVNYKVLNCSNLFLDLNNYRHNKAVIICTVCIFFSVLFLVLFFCRGISKIRIIMYNEIPTDKKIKQLIIEKLKINKIISSSNPLKKISNKNLYNNKNKRTVKFKVDNKILNYKDSNDKFNRTNFTFSNERKKTNRTLSHNIYKKKKSKNKRYLYTYNLENKNNKMNKNNKKNVIEIEYDYLPFTMALRLEKRNLFYILD